MNKMLSLVAGLFFVGAVSADMVTISGYTWDTPQDMYTLNAIFERSGMNFADYSQVDVETWLAYTADCWILEEVAANENINSFGYYDVNTMTRTQLFPGSSSDGDYKSVVISNTDPKNIGFYLDAKNEGVNQNIFYTQDALNGGIGQVAVFQNNNNTKEFVLAWEDISMASGVKEKYTQGYSDGDFNDFVVKARVPEPATLSLIGLSLLSLSGLSFFRRKRN